MKNKYIKIIAYAITPIILFIFSIYYQVQNIPNILFLREDSQPKSGYFIKLLNQNSPVKNGDSVKVSNLLSNNEQNTKINVSFLGVLPVKTVNVKVVPKEIKLYPGGQPIGVKLATKGVLVVGFADIEEERGKATSPAALCGVEVGDNILKLNDKNINSAEDLARAVNDSQGKELIVTLERKNSQNQIKITPVKSNIDQNYKLGLWVRDSSAGVGTLTFYDKTTNKFAALGHPITDMDTNNIIKISSGEIVSSSIISVRKGVRGTPGELKGIFVNEQNTLGNVIKNTECGIFGESSTALTNDRYNKPLKVGLRNEIKEGEAYILTTIDGNEPEKYSIRIEKLLEQDSPGPKSMVIRITDPRLLEKTGGIVQGMSGSPIIQDDKLIGAVTHVLINKPDVGYGIYIEWMLKDADIIP